MAGQRGRRACALLALMAAALWAAPALGGSVAIVGGPANSTEGLGEFTGVLSYEADPLSTTGTLTVMLTSTSDPANGGFITGFLFNIASSDPLASATLTGTPEPSHPFEQCTGLGLNGQPFGNPYDSGAALGGTFLGGPAPQDGIGVGDTGTFAFEVAASDAGSLTATDFLTGGPYEYDFLVRFRGFLDGGSDKVAAVPLPAPFALGVAGLVGVLILRRRMCGTTRT